MSIGEFLSGLAARRAPSGGQREKLRGAAQRFAALVSSGSQTLADEAPARVTLHVESGLHRGASLDLTADEYLLGSSADCDIILRDAGVAPRQCRLVRADPTFVLLDVPTAASQPASPRAVEREAGAIRSRYEIGGVTIAVLSQAPPSQAATPAESASQPRAPAWLFSGTAAAAVVLTTIALATVHLLAKGTSPDLAERVAAGGQALAAQGFDAVHFRGGSGGHLEIAGLVPDDKEQARLRGWLDRSGYGDARSSVQSAAGFVEQVRHTFGNEDLQIGFHDGRLRIEGTTQQLEVKKRIRTMTDELKGVVDIEDRVAYVDARQRTSPGSLPVRIRDVMISAPGHSTGYFRADTGERYFEGAVMPDGAEVLAIEDAQIRFRLAEKIVVYPLER